MKSYCAKVRVNNRTVDKEFKSIRELVTFANSRGNPIPYMTVYMRIRPKEKGGMGWSIEQALRVKVNHFSRRNVIQEEKSEQVTDFQDIFPEGIGVATAG